MKMKNIQKIPGFFATLIFFLAIIGCSGAGLNPLSPQKPVDNQTSNQMPYVISSADNLSTTAEGVLGLYQGFIDLKNMSAELTPLRIEASGKTDSTEIDITAFLTQLPCKNCAKITGMAMDSNGNPILRIGIKHPFQPGDPTKPPTGINRLDLHLFTIRGFIISDGNQDPRIFEGSTMTLGGFQLDSADGYSGEFDSFWDTYFMTTANLHPYVLHFDNYGIGNFDPTSPNGFTDVKNPEGNLVMKMGSEYDVQSYTFEVSGANTFNFLFSITASYGVSAANKNERLNPTYRVPLFNSKPASEVRVTNVDDSQFFAGNSQASCTLTLEVMDINHGAPIGEGLDQMTVDSSVKQIDVEIPGVTDPLWTTSTPELFYVSGDGRNTPLIYNLLVTNDKAAAIGIYNGLVKVVDGFTGTGNLPGNAIHRVPPGTSTSTGFFTVDQWATYSTFQVEIVKACGPITGSITNPSQSAITINNEDTVNFSGQGSSANGGNPIVKYEWFWGDGSNNSTGQNVQHQFNNSNCGGNNQPQIFTVSLKLTDSCTPPNITQVDTVAVTVNCPTCINYYENFDGGTKGDWDVSDWAFSNVDDSGLNYGGWDEYKDQMTGPNCTQTMCSSGNCYFTSGDNIPAGMPPGYCNDYSGTGHYYLTTPLIDLTNLEVTQVTMTVKHFYQVLNSSNPDGCAVYASTNGGLTFTDHVAVSSGANYNATFTSGIRNGDTCFSGVSQANGIVQSIFNLTPFIGQSQVKLRFEQHNNNEGAIGTMGFPVGWWIDEITIDICP